ncbi:LCP family protein [Cytobacillus sp. Hz8]|uniref:LCP family protein n=1 Tax=Cytobacillus sp. Hz8 TaxID=3347168 RepID=UPI0035DC4BFA
MGRQQYQKQKRKKKKKRWKTVILVLILIIAGTLGYAFYQYRQGVLQSEKKANVNKEEYSFNEAKDQYGGTNILLLGSDARGKENSRADTIMIMQYHPKNKTYKLISIMRDSYVSIPGHDNNRINTAFAFGGPELLRQTIKENFDIDLQYYAIVDFEGFVQLIDEAFPDGVEVNVEKEMSTNIGVTLKPGLQRLDGKHLLGYVRFRHDAIGDFGRVERQQKVVKEVVNELTSLQTIPKLPKLVGVVTPFINTNLSTGNMLYIGKDFLSQKNRNIETLRVPVDGSYANETINGAAVLSVDLEKNKEEIRKFLSK